MLGKAHRGATEASNATCFVATLPSTGSVYVNSSFVLVRVNSPTLPANRRYHVHTRVIHTRTQTHSHTHSQLWAALHVHSSSLELTSSIFARKWSINSLALAASTAS